MKKQLFSLFMVISLTVLFCCACKNATEETREINQAGIDSTKIDTELIDSTKTGKELIEYISDGRMEIDKRSLWGYSTEGGEIIRYRDSSGRTIRYRLIYYGETGRKEENYYFLSDNIYYTELIENYRYPISFYIGIPIEVLDREFKQGVLMDGVCYQYDGVEGVLSHYSTITIPYSSQKELDDVFELADAEDVPERHFLDGGILAINGYLLGGYYNDQWITWEELYPMMPDEDTYKIYVKGQYQGEASGEKKPKTEVELYCGPCIDFKDNEYGFDDYNSVVAYSGSENLQIESGASISLESELYINELKKYLLKMRFMEKFELTNIVKIDLDGDGQDEVFIQAYHGEDLTSASIGIQYMRKIVGGKVESFVIPIMAPNVSADHLSIIGFCDINGDGSKELLMSAMGTGYHNYMVYEFINNGFIRIFENGGNH